MLVAAYNGPMGTHLRDIFGAKAVMFGLMFNQGAFRATDMMTKRVAVFTVDAGPNVPTQHRTRHLRVVSGGAR